MTQASCEAIPPSGMRIEDGARVYRSQHVVVAINDTGSGILYNIEATLFDSEGRRASSSAINVVSPGEGSQSSSAALVVDLDANLFVSGSVVELICETHVTGGFSAVARETRVITVV